MIPATYHPSLPGVNLAPELDWHEVRWRALDGSNRHVGSQWIARDRDGVELGVVMEIRGEYGPRFWGRLASGKSCGPSQRSLPAAQAQLFGAWRAVRS